MPPFLGKTEKIRKKRNSCLRELLPHKGALEKERNQGGFQGRRTTVECRRLLQGVPCGDCH